MRLVVAAALEKLERETKYGTMQTGDHRPAITLRFEWCYDRGG